MIYIEDNAYNYALKNNYSFVIKIINVNLCWGNTPSKALWVECKNFYDDITNYTSFEYKNVKIYVEKSLKLSSNIKIYKNKKSYFRNNSFGVYGVGISKNKS